LAGAASAILLAAGAPAFAAEKEPAAVEGLERREGLVPVYVDAKKGRILVALPKPDASGVAGRYLYASALKTGLGSAPVGLDRARLGDTQVLAFRQVGGRVLAEFENPRFRAAGAPAAEQTAAREAFATSVVWAGKIEQTLPDGRLVVDLADFVTRDVIGIADALKQAGEAGWKPVKELTLADPAAVKVFPQNVEFEAIQTYAAETSGPEIRNIAPDAKVLTLVVRHSLVKLPEPGFQVRPFDPRSGAFDGVVLDYAAPLDRDIVQRLVRRFRLEKTDPAAAVSTVKTPIVFYVDRAAPEPIRTALQEGAQWWAQAFEAAGFKDAYRVEILPEGVDPLDVRYSVINWVNRATRGWSYGQAVTDPRTGEIVKGSVLLGSLRVRQDMLIFEGLVGADESGKGGPNDPIQAALARIRQLSAHEVGHALGFAHNFAASSQDRASVMDYPAPRVKLTNGQIDLSDAYGVGVGAWDRFIVDWLYADGDPAAKATKAAQTLRYITDQDARGVGTGQPHGAIWDDGAEPVAELARVMQVRRAAIDRFGPQALRPGEPAQALKRKYVPIYLIHRYQLEAAAKPLGGVDFAYAVRGDAAMTAKVVPAAQQRAALAGLLAAMAPAELDTPEALIPLLSSGQSGESDRQYQIEVFDGAGGPVFDALAAADVAAGMVLDALLAPDRLARLVDQHRRDPDQPGVGEVIDRLVEHAFTPADGRLAEVARRVQTRTVLELAATTRRPDVSPAAKAEIAQRLSELATQLSRTRRGDPSERAHRLTLANLLQDKEELVRVLAQPKRRPEAPPGMPIGSDED
jgi:hypothetical protein